MERAGSLLARRTAAIEPVGGLVWGWSQAFRHTTNPHVWSSLDGEIDKRIGRLDAVTDRALSGGDRLVSRRVRGVRLLSDLAFEPLPDALMYENEGV
jgi:hypothetical protein